MIYFDHNASSPMHPRARAAIESLSERRLGHPQSLHQAGRLAAQTLEELTTKLWKWMGPLIDTDPTPAVIWSTSGSAANRAALTALARHKQTGGRGSANRIIVSSVEHPCVLSAASLLAGDAHRIERLAVDQSGQVDLDHLAQLLRSPARCVAVQWVNHETGRIQPIQRIHTMCAEADVPLHVDGVQGFGKLDTTAVRCQSFVFSAHKFGGPRGLAAWIVDRRFLPPEMSDWQSGSPPIELLGGAIEALEVSLDSETRSRLSAWRDRIEATLRSAHPTMIVHAAEAPRVDQTSNIAFPPVDRQLLLMALDLEGLCCSAGAACASGSPEPSPTLQAMGVDGAIIESSIRLSLGITTTQSDIEQGIEILVRVLDRLRSTPSHGRAAPNRSENPL